MSKCIECRLPVTDLSEHFQKGGGQETSPSKSFGPNKSLECNTCKMSLPSKCSLRSVVDTYKNTQHTKTFSMSCSLWKFYVSKVENRQFLDLIVRLLKIYHDVKKIRKN